MDGRTTPATRTFLPATARKAAEFFGCVQPDAQAVVTICELNVSTTPAACSGAPLIDPGPVTADLVGQQYKVNWDTRQSAISVDKFYRIQCSDRAAGCCWLCRRGSRE